MQYRIEDGWWIQRGAGEVPLPTAFSASFPRRHRDLQTSLVHSIYGNPRAIGRMDSPNTLERIEVHLNPLGNLDKTCATITRRPSILFIGTAKKPTKNPAERPVLAGIRSRVL